MTRRIRRYDDPSTHAPPASQGDAEATARADGFSLQFSAGRGLLTLREQRLPHGLVVNSLTMAIADIAFPFDISQGIGGLRHRRHQLHALEATLSFDDAHDWLARQVPGTIWNDACQMSFEPEGVALLLSPRSDAAAGALSLRLVPQCHGSELCVRIEEPRAYGPVSEPLLDAAAQRVEALLGVSVTDMSFALPNLLHHCLMHALAPKGWRLPDTANTALDAVHIAPEALRLVYRAAHAPPAPVSTPASKRETEPQSTRDTLAVMAHRAALDGDAASELNFLHRLLPHSNPLETLGAARRVAHLHPLADPEHIAAFWQQALAQTPKAPQLLWAAIEAHARLADAPAVHRLLPQWLAQQQTDAARQDAHLRAGQLLLTHFNDGAGAQPHFEQVLQWHPDDDDATWGLAQSLAQQPGDAHATKQAVSLYEKWQARAIQAGDNRNAARAAVALADLWFDNGELELALTHYADALARAWDADVQLRMARALTALGRVAEGVGLYEEALRRTENRDAEWGHQALTLARLYLSSLEDYVAADAWARDAAQCPGCEAAAASLRVQLLEKQQRWGELTHALEQQLQASPTPEAALKLARAQMQSGSFAAAMHTLAPLRAQHPSREDLLEIFIDAARAARDIPALRQSLRERHALSGTASVRAAVAMELGDLAADPTEAHQWFASATRDGPDALEAWEGLVAATTALSLLEERDTAQAQLIQRYEQRGLRDRAAALLCERAQYQLARGDADEAAALWQQALPDVADAERPAVMRQLGALRLQQKQFEQAQTLFATARREGAPEDRFDAALGEAEAAAALGAHAEAWDAAVLAGSGPAGLRIRAVQVIARVAAAVQKVPEAIQIMARVAQNTPDETDALALFSQAADMAETEHRDLPLALSICEDALETLPNSDRVRYRIIALLEKMGRRVDLAYALFRFASRDPSGIAELQRAADFFSAESLHDEAVDALALAHRLGPSPESARMLALALRRVGRNDELEALLQPWSREDDTLRDMLATHLRDTEQHAALIALLSPIAEEDPAREMQRQTQLAEAFEALGDADDALLQRLLTEMDDWPEGAQQQLGQAALQHRLNQRDYVGAAQSWRDFVQRFGDDPALWQTLVSALSGHHQPALLADAIRLRLKSDISDADRITDNWLLARIAKEQLGDDAGYAAALTAVISLAPRHIEAGLALAAHAFATGDMPALKTRLAALSSLPWQPELALWMGAVAAHEGRMDDAREHFHALMSRAPETPGAAEALLQWLSAETDDDTVLQAVALLGERLTAIKNHPQAALRVGMAFFRRDELAEARDFLQAAADSDTDTGIDDATALATLVRIYKREGDHERQAQALSRLGQLHTGDARTDAWVAAARIYLDELGDAERAYFWFSQAAKNAPDEPDVLLGLADCGWENRAWPVVAQNLERLRLVAPHFALDATRMYRLAAALTETRQWPVADILEWLERALPALTEAERRDADALKERLTAQQHRR